LMKGEVAEVKKVEANKNASTRLDAIVRKLIGLFYYLDKNPIPNIDVESHRTSIKQIVGNQYDNFIKNLEPFKDELILETEVTYSNQKDILDNLNELMLNFEEDIVRGEFSTAMAELAQAERNKDNTNVNELVKRIDILTKRTNELSKRRVSK